MSNANADEGRKLWLELMAGIEPTDQSWPAGLLHYTKLATFKEIAKNKSLMLFNVMAMADRHESDQNFQKMRLWFRYATDFQKRVATLDSLIPPISGSIPGLGSELLAYLDNHATLDQIQTYITCFSATDPKHPTGRLSMWRAFGGDGAGVAIEFSTTLLRKHRMTLNWPVVLYPVRYEADNEFYATLLAILDRVVAMGAAVKAFRLANSKSCIWSLYQAIAIACATRKHPGFIEEAEWRLISFGNYDNTSGPLQPEVISIGSGIRIGLTLKIEEYLKGIGGAPIGDLITRVIVGPCDPIVPTSQAVIQLLVEMGFGNLNGRWSICDTPYRPNR